MLNIKNLSFRYTKKGKDVLNDICLSLNDGEIGIVLGKNGSGKSTLFKCLLGINKANCGEIYLNSQDINKLKRKQRAKKIAYVPQDITFGALSVYDSILLGRIAYFEFASSYEDQLVVNNIIKEMGLENIAFKNVNELSGGERQKVTIARALVQEPELLVFDEPTGNLDISNEQLILNEAKKLAKKKNIMILMAVHDINLALNYGDHFYLIKDGKIMFEGNKEIINSKTIKETFNVDSEIVDIGSQKVFVTKKGNE